MIEVFQHLNNMFRQRDACKGFMFGCQYWLGWQQMNNEQCDNKTHRKAEFMKLLNENGSIKPRSHKKNSWIVALAAQEFGCFQGLTETPSILAACPLTVSIPILSFNHSSVWIIWFRSSLTQTYCRSASSYSIYTALPTARPWAEEWSFLKTHKNGVFTKAETESDDARASPHLIFCELEEKQMCAHSRHSRQTDEKLIDQCDKCEPRVDIFLQAHTREIKHQQSASWRIGM